MKTSVIEKMIITMNRILPLRLLIRLVIKSFFFLNYPENDH